MWSKLAFPQYLENAKNALCKQLLKVPISEFFQFFTHCWVLTPCMNEWVTESSNVKFTVSDHVDDASYDQSHYHNPTQMGWDRNKENGSRWSGRKFHVNVSYEKYRRPRAEFIECLVNKNLLDERRSLEGLQNCKYQKKM